MMTLEHQAGQTVAMDTDTWLADFLNRHSADGLGDQTRRDHHDRLRAATLVQIINAIETANHKPDARAVIELYQQWILSQPPGSQHLYLAWFNLGVEFCQAGDQPNATVAYQSALALRPDFHSAAVNLGTVLEARGMPDAALQTWERSIQPDDARVTLLNNRARVLEQLGRFGEAEQEMRRTLLTKPNQPDVIQHWVHVRQKMCQWPILTTEIAGLSIDDLMRHAGPLSTLALTDDIDLQRQAGRDWIARKTFPVPLALSPPDGYRHDRIRVGYLSSDFCRHAMSYLIAELFERHDRVRFEVFGYCSSPEDGSDIRARVIRSFDQFRSIKHTPDDEAARVIRNDEIDILIDLNGLTSGARPQILRSRPAPVLATYLGFVGPVPLPELDYMLCDEIVVPEFLVSAYDPKPLHIAANYQANDSKRTIGAATTRLAAGLPADKFVFCCFSNHYKTTEQMFSAWMEILWNSGDSVLWLVGDNEWAQRNMLARAAEFGIDPARIIFASRVGPDEYMARLPLANLFLDTFPYNAGTIASDAIRMGLPLLTMSGRSFASRMAASLLTAAGASQGVVTSLRAYVEFAVRMATDKSAFDAYKGIFSVDAWHRDIGNIETFTASFEKALSAIAKRPTVCTR